MIVLVTTACPTGLRGDVSRWLMEIAPGVYVGHLSARVRDYLWGRVIGGCGSGRALLVSTARNEQGFLVKLHNYDWQEKDYDGLALLQRPTGQPQVQSPKQTGWSTARRRRMYHRGKGDAPK